MRETIKFRQRETVRVKSLFDAVLKKAKDIQIKNGPGLSEITCALDDGNIIEFSRRYEWYEIETWRVTGKEGLDLHGFDTFEEYMKSKGLHTGYVKVIEEDGTDWKYCFLTADDDKFELKYYRSV